MKRLVVAVSSALVLMLITSACAPAAKWKDGTYSGSGKGMGGPIAVTVKVEKGRITAVDVTQHQETPGISDSAIAKIPQLIVEKQSTDVEAVSGATYTSNGIKEAVQNALSQAKK
ncbi:MAG TPA: FMN-binding protein [Firmicutes bacterium]|nr:hypothetical protein [Bacillota bacterium]HHV56586.1 FMN-binding protein [Bacillota bacterium]